LNDPIIDALKKEQSRVAMEFFQRPPKSHDVAFDYGYAQGVYHGVELAINRILKMYRDDRERELE
jgi:hypothetical protein